MRPRWPWVSCWTRRRQRSRAAPNWHSSYGYQWWLIDAGPHTYALAWGHGGQQIAVLPEKDLVVVVTADPLYGQFGDGPWALEKSNPNLVANFIAGIPQA